MRLWISVILGGLILTGARPAQGDDESMPIKNLSLPLDRDENGRIKTQLVAEQASVPVEGPVLAKKVRLEFYKGDEIEALMMADDCRYDRAGETAASESHVRIEREGVTITGRTFECNMKDQTMKILHDVKVVLDNKKNPLKEIKKGE